MLPARAVLVLRSKDRAKIDSSTNAQSGHVSNFWVGTIIRPVATSFVRKLKQSISTYQRRSELSLPYYSRTSNSFAERLSAKE